MSKYKIHHLNDNNVTILDYKIPVKIVTVGDCMIIILYNIHI